MRGALDLARDIMLGLVSPNRFGALFDGDDVLAFKVDQGHSGASANRIVDCTANTIITSFIALSSIMSLSE